MHASNPETIHSDGSGDWTEAWLITVSGSARTVPMSHRDKRMLIHCVAQKGNRRWVRWALDQLFGGRLCRKCLYLKLLKSGHPSSIYNRQCRGCFFWCFPFILTPISRVPFSQGSTEAQIEWGGSLNGHLMASCVRNMCTKNYQFFSKLQSIMSGMLFSDTVYMAILHITIDTQSINSNSSCHFFCYLLPIE